jgi:hypothetical protein
MEKKLSLEALLITVNPNTIIITVGIRCQLNGKADLSSCSHFVTRFTKNCSILRMIDKAENEELQL